MLKLTPQQTADYLHRSYAAVDGLWFMKVEQVLGFDKTLDIDAEVWKVMPKIQARKLKELAGHSFGLDALFQCFSCKLTLDGFTFSARRPTSDCIEFLVQSCPWIRLLAKANRQHLAQTIGTRICDTEYAVWAGEFGPGISVEFPCRICSGCQQCTIRFQNSPPDPPRYSPSP